MILSDFHDHGQDHGIALGGLIAVSYTHLDVYKRQVCSSAPLAMTAAGIPAMPIWERVASVSYTHLDVYKRQA